MPSYRLIYTPSLDEPPMIDGIVHAADEVEARSRVPSLGDQLLVLDLSAKLGSDTLCEEWMAGERWVEALVERERAGPGNSPRAEALIGSFTSAPTARGGAVSIPAPARQDTSAHKRIFARAEIQ